MAALYLQHSLIGVLLQSLRYTHTSNSCFRCSSLIVVYLRRKHSSSFSFTCSRVLILVLFSNTVHVAWKFRLIKTEAHVVFVYRLKRVSRQLSTKK